eukprot:COSAG02_NODE_4641_length_5137_cov_114.825057_6_plen_43_part_00
MRTAGGGGGGTSGKGGYREDTGIACHALQTPLIDPISTKVLW